MDKLDNLYYLIIDDDEAFANTLANRLRQTGARTAIALDQTQALTLCRQDNPDRVVLDMRLANYSGLRLLKELRAIRPELCVVVLTGYSSIPTAVEAIKLGAHNYLCKPAGLAEILSAFGSERADPELTLPDQAPSIDRLEWEHIQRMLNENDGNISATARALGMHRRTLQRKLQKRPKRQ